MPEDTSNSEGEVVTIDSLDADGYGEGRLARGRKVAVAGVLPGERVRLKHVRRWKHRHRAFADEVLEASPDRVEAACPHFPQCGGCALQHLAPTVQRRIKTERLLEQLGGANVSPDEVFDPIFGPSYGYRRKARLGARFVPKKETVMVGFRETHSSKVAALEACAVLDPRVGGRIRELRAMVRDLSAFQNVPQIEVAAADDQVALVIRHLIDLDDADRERLRGFARDHGFHIFLQPGGPDTVHLLGSEPPTLSYRLASHDVELQFLPTQFVQVNPEVNEQMVSRALELLDIQPSERVLDLFCGIGNFTLPLARHARDVVGVEGEVALVEQARQNARRNRIENATFEVADLSRADRMWDWAGASANKLLLDPPRRGAQEILGLVGQLGLLRIVYVSCNPETLARDAGELVHRHGYRLGGVGVIDMFPHTSHTESISLFVAPDAAV